MSFRAHKELSLIHIFLYAAGRDAAQQRIELLCAEGGYFAVQDIKMGIENFVPVQKEVHQWSDRRKAVSYTHLTEYGRTERRIA